MTTRDMVHPWGRSEEFRRASQRSVPLTFLRSNGTLFYSIAAASLLEARAPGCADRACVAFADDPTFCDWIRSVWSPGRIARMYRLKEYLALTWPEFDSAAAHDRFLRASAPLIARRRPASPAQEALTRCAAASQSSLYYRCLGHWAEDVRLREMARDMAREDESAFARFRGKYESAARAERLGMWTSWRSANTHVREARDTYVQSAFHALVEQWGPNAPFATMEYAEFVKRIKAVIDRYGELGWVERFVLRAWAGSPSANGEHTKSKAVRGFKPVIETNAGTQSQTYYRWNLQASRGIDA